MATDILSLLDDRGERPAAVERLVGSGGEDAHARAFRIDLASGRTVKGHLLDSPEKAKSTEVLSRGLSLNEVPTVLGRRSNALLVEWVEGRSLHRRQLTVSLLVGAGDLLGRIHSTSPSRVSEPVLEQPMPSRDRTELDLMRLAEGGFIAGSDVVEALAAIDASPIDRPLRTIIHRDFCGENLVECADRLSIVDNETLTIGHPDYDLARTWYRWPLSRSHFELFLEGYSKHRDPLPFREQAARWVLPVLVAAASFRMDVGSAPHSVPIGRLLGWLRQQEVGGSPLAPPAARR